MSKLFSQKTLIRIFWSLLFLSVIALVGGIYRLVDILSLEQEQRQVLRDDSRCETVLQAYHRQGTPVALATAHEHFLQLAEEALSVRAATIDIAKRLERRQQQGLPLNGADLKTMNEGMLTHLSLRQALMEMAANHECWTVLSDTDLENYQLNPAQRVHGVMISLASALVLYDNYLLAISLYEDNAHLRGLLNLEDSGYGIVSDQLHAVTVSYNSIENRSRVRRAIEFYEDHWPKIPANQQTAPEYAYLHSLISQSPSYNMTKRFSPLYVLGRKLKFLTGLGQDEVDRLNREGMNLFSMAFGNTLGLVETRKGKLHGNPEVLRQLIDRLQPGDILLEKTPFRLTDKFIPGHYGHAAIWTGDEQDLQALELWDVDQVRPYHDDIRVGGRIVEALRQGVQLSSLQHFLNIDDLTVLRLRDVTPEKQRAIVLEAFRQIGKGYDFNFDVETTDRIVCSELVYVTYTDIQWPTARTLGRATISPDQVALRALNDGPLELVALYHDGEYIEHEALKRFAALLDDQLPLSSLSE